MKTNTREIEDLRKLLAFYMSEGRPHAIELEYRLLADMDPKQRTPQQVNRLVRLAQVLSNAVGECSPSLKA